MSESVKSVLTYDTIIAKAPEFVLIFTEDGVIVDGGRKLEFLNGPLALSLLPVLFPLINGNRTYADLLALMPHVPQAHTRELIERLVSWGVLVSHHEAVPWLPEMRNTLSFIKRGNPEADLEKASGILKHKQISIVGERNSLIAIALANGLQMNGFRKITVIATEDLAPLSIGNDAFLITVFNGIPDSVETNECYSRLRTSDAPWLRTTLNIANGTGEIGPIFYPGSSLCFACLNRALPLQQYETSVDDIEIYSIWAALLATEVTAQLLQGAHPGPRSYRKIYLPLFQHEVKTWSSAGTCVMPHTEASRMKSPTTPRSNWHDLLPFFYEESMTNRQEIAESLPWGNNLATLRLPAKLMLNSAHIALPAAEMSLRQPVIELLMSGYARRGSQLDLTTISPLLALSVGFKPGSSDTSRRWAPSGGNLGSVEAYLVVRDIQGLEAGVYLYKPEQHTLAKLNQRRIDHVQAVLAATSPHDTAAAMVVFVGGYSRIAYKYGAFAYKLLHLDAGVACSQLLLVAAALGVSVESVPEWQPAALEEALALRSLQEIPTQVFLLATKRKSRYAPSLVQTGKMNAEITSPGECLSLQQLADLPADLLVEKLLHTNQFVRSGLPSSFKPSKSLGMICLRWRISGIGRRQETLGGVLNRRSSIRRFSERVLQGADIRAILKVALANNVFLDSKLTITVLVQHSSDLMPGVYAYDANTASLTQKREVFSSDRTARLFFQTGYENTPLIIWISGDVREAARGDGCGYQTLLLRSGYLGHRLWMASLGFGLGGILLAGINSEAQVRSDEMTDQHHTDLFAFLCGYPGTQDKGREEVA